jgi:hypothetical protein
MSEEKAFRRFSDFYPFYLGEHANRSSRRLHFVGSCLAIVLLVAALVTRHGWLLAVALVEGYAFAWVGHFFFEHNPPATFQYPRYSFMGSRPAGSGSRAGGRGLATAG